MPPHTTGRCNASRQIYQCASCAAKNWERGAKSTKRSVRSRRSRVQAPTPTGATYAWPGVAAAGVDAEDREAGEDVRFCLHGNRFVRFKRPALRQELPSGVEAGGCTCVGELISGQRSWRLGGRRSNRRPNRASKPPSARQCGALRPCVPSGCEFQHGGRPRRTARRMPPAQVADMAGLARRTIACSERKLLPTMPARPGLRGRHASMKRPTLAVSPLGAMAFRVPLASSAGGDDGCER